MKSKWEKRRLLKAIQRARGLPCLSMAVAQRSTRDLVAHDVSWTMLQKLWPYPMISAIFPWNLFADFKPPVYHDNKGLIISIAVAVIVSVSLIIRGQSLTQKQIEERIYRSRYAMHGELTEKDDDNGRLLELVDPKLGSEFSEKDVCIVVYIAMMCINMSPTLRPL
ncbi:hypothetical protein YC2023_089931 [Brassica napus]